MLKDWWNGIKLWWRDFRRLSFIDWRWLFIWVAIYLTFLSLDIIAPGYQGTALLKYLGIFLCLVYARQKYHHDYLLSAAILLTFVADTVLVWTNHEVIGVFIFCFAQLLHVIRQTNTKPKAIILYGIAVTLIFAFAVSAGYLLPIYAITMIYGALLCFNLFIARRNYRQHIYDFKARCAYYAFISFLCCDICVALRHLMLDGILSIQFLPLVGFLVWVFYYPSQVLMANSSRQPESQHRVKLQKTTL